MIFYDISTNTTRYRTVIRQFEKQLTKYTTDAASHTSSIVPIVVKWLRTRPKNTVPKICEFGGAGGYLLWEIQQKTKRPLELHVAELVAKFGTALASKQIKFHHQSILNSTFKDNTFDVVIVRNVIHHLLHTTLPKTRVNQQHAILELARITKPGGLIVIDEQVNHSKLACNVFYYGSRLATKLKLNIPQFEITPDTVVAYLQPPELRAMCEKAVPKKHWIHNLFERWAPSWHWKLTGMMNNTGSAIIVMQKPR